MITVISKILSCKNLDLIHQQQRHLNRFMGFGFSVFLLFIQNTIKPSRNTNLPVPELFVGFLLLPHDNFFHSQ